ncbi:DUF2784 domain-containing protein [Yinghuangia seranimata]|uniref:DUF2784 domain-containing protein n=1 Tax=Yinghuangia seranimata TaxID=408067 RepID=UPI00248AA521|nr:DUF2784 domain-containing protein [Yinghuangia seranimata]MDI2126496.1 DUF2784 domain-containing protein [Yinghuangia seranimata]
MGYRILVGAAVVSHVAFLLYVVLGGFLAWRRPRLIWPHVAAAIWGVLILADAVDCPLTYLETWARERAGMSPLPSTGFIDYYIEGNVYPKAWTPLVQAAVIGCVLFSWTVPARRALTRWLPRGGGAPRRPGPR